MWVRIVVAALELLELAEVLFFGVEELRVELVLAGQGLDEPEFGVAELRL